MLQVTMLSESRDDIQQLARSSELGALVEGKSAREKRWREGRRAYLMKKYLFILEGRDQDQMN